MKLHVVRISEPTWRQAAERHQTRIRDLLRPGLMPPPLSTSKRRQRTRQPELHSTTNDWTALNEMHPVYNFLVEYYGLKGTKGPRRLSRWSPNFESSATMLHVHPESIIQDFPGKTDREMIGSSGLRTSVDNGILLEGASEQDLGGTLHLRGATLQTGGVLYSPPLFFSQDSKHPASAGAFVWYRDLMEQTLKAEPILHCYGLHEWAMLYQPEGEPTPLSSQYQAHLPLRCNRREINAVVERKSKLSCTHYDALRFFAPAARPRNAYGSVDDLRRYDQLRLEQPACVHVQMDLLKAVLRLQPFCSSDLVERALDVALDARRLDVAASPYDASAYGIEAVPVETSEGRALYRSRQLQLMQRANVVRQDLLHAYNVFLQLAFSSDDVAAAQNRNQEAALV